MRRLLLRHRWTSYLVTGLLLFATSGATLSRMTCLMGGHSVLSLGLATECCPKSDTDGVPVLKSTCCDVTEARLGQPDLLPSEQLAMDPFLNGVSWMAPPSIASELVLWPEWLETRPPPKDAPERLAFLRTRSV